MAGIQNRHIVFFRHSVNCAHQAEKVLFNVDIFLPMSGKQNVFSMFQPQRVQDIAVVKLLLASVQYLSHRRTDNKCIFRSDSAFQNISPGVIRIAKIDITCHINNPSNDLLR